MGSLRIYLLTKGSSSPSLASAASSTPAGSRTSPDLRPWPTPPRVHGLDDPARRHPGALALRNEKGRSAFRRAAKSREETPTWACARRHIAATQHDELGSAALQHGLARLHRRPRPDPELRPPAAPGRHRGLTVVAREDVDLDRVDRARVASRQAGRCCVSDTRQPATPRRQPKVLDLLDRGRQVVELSYY